MTVRIADDVLPAWEEVADEEPSLLLQLRGGDDLQRVRRALAEMPVGTGGWQATGGAGGVILRVEEPDDLEQSLTALAAALERHGVEGTIGLYSPPEVPKRPRAAHLLECRLRPRGRTVRRGDRHYGWEYDRDALLRLIRLAAGWCVDGGRRGEPALRAGMVAAALLPPDEDAADRLAQSLGTPDLTVLWTVAEGQLRCVSLEPFEGRVSLIETLPDGRWEATYARFKDILRTAAGDLAYGLVKRGSAVSQAIMGESIAYDWPPREGVTPASPSGEPFESARAPDAFGLQLLGPGYAGRIPQGPHWRSEPAGPEAALLEHVDPAAWMDEPFVPFGPSYTTATSVEPPPLLAGARADLDGLLFHPDRDQPPPDGRG